MAAAKNVDKEAIERDVRAGILSVREIAAQHEISHTLLNRWIKQHAWARDLSVKIQAKAEALVAEREAQRETPSEKRATEREIIEANAERIAQVRSDHRVDIRRARELAGRLFGELDAQTESPEQFEQLFELLHDPEEDDSQAAKDRQFKRRQAFERAMSLGGRTATMKALSETLKNLVGLEREAYGIDKGAQPADPNAPIDMHETARRLAFMLASAANRPTFIKEGTGG